MLRVKKEDLKNLKFSLKIVRLFRIETLVVGSYLDCREILVRSSVAKFQGAHHNVQTLVLEREGNSNSSFNCTLLE